MLSTNELRVPSGCADSMECVPLENVPVLASSNKFSRSSANVTSKLDEIATTLTLNRLKRALSLESGMEKFSHQKRLKSCSNIGRHSVNNRSKALCSVRFDLSATTVHCLSRPYYKIDPISSTFKFLSSTLKEYKSQSSCVEAADHRVAALMWYSRKDLYAMRILGKAVCRKICNEEDLNMMCSLSVSVATKNTVDMANTFNIINDGTDNDVGTRASKLEKRPLQKAASQGVPNAREATFIAPFSLSTIGSLVSKLDNDLETLSNLDSVCRSITIQHLRGLERWSNDEHNLSRRHRRLICHTQFFLEQAAQVCSGIREPEKLAEVYKLGSKRATEFAILLGRIDYYVSLLQKVE